MKVITRIIGFTDPPTVVWPEDWPLPAEGQEVTLYDPDVLLFVRHVIWFPQGDFSHDEPFVYLVMGPPIR